MNKVEKFLKAWNDGMITEGELFSHLFECFDEVGPKAMAESLPESIKKEFVKDVQSFLATPPDKVYFIMGGTFLNPESYENYMEARKKQINSYRPKMREFLKYVK